MTRRDTGLPLTTGRARRALTVGGLTGQVGASYLLSLVKRPFQSDDAREATLLDTHLKNAMRIVEGSQALRGTFLKAMQMVSMRGDLLPAEVTDVLSVVQSDVPPMPWEMIRDQLQAELGAAPEDAFAELEHEAFAAASLGQVHRARLHGGEDVVVKVQYPGIDATVEQDLGNVKALGQAVATIGRDVLRQPIDVDEMVVELEDRLAEELDYELEARNMARFAREFADDDEIVIPCPVPELSSRRILTMSYIDGYRLADVMGPGVDQDLKDWVAVKLFRTLWRQILELGCLHTDPHPGNYLVTFHPKLAILDFGSIRIFPDEIRRGYLRLSRSLMDGDRSNAGEALATLGLIGPEDDPRPMLQMLDIIFEPAYRDGVYDPAEYDPVDRAMRAAAIKMEHRLFRAPGHMLFLGRALVGLDSYLQQFGTRTNFHRLFHECIREAEAKEAAPS